MSTTQTTKNCITLRGSAQIIAEYLSKWSCVNAWAAVTMAPTQNHCAKHKGLHGKRYWFSFQNMVLIQFYFNVVFIHPKLLRIHSNMV